MKSKNNFLLFTIIWVMFSCLCCIDVHAITTGDTFGQNDVNSKIITDTAKLTVYDVWDGEAFSAYKILDAFYNSSTNVVSYEFTFDFQSFLMSEEGKDYSDLTVDDWYHYKDNSSDFNHLINAYTSYIKKNFIHGIPMDTNDNERISSKTLQAGSYLVLPTNAIAVYSVMIGNLDITAVENDWQINDAEIRAKSELPEVEKCVFDSIMGDWSTSSASITSYSMGDVIPFKIEATLPTYPSDATNKTYVITDVISEGFAFQTDSFLVIDGWEDYGVPIDMSDDSIHFSDNQVIIELDVDQFTTPYVTVMYQAKLTENAELGLNGVNTNTAHLTYSNDPYGSSTSITPDSKVNVYTFGLVLNKIDEDFNLIRSNETGFTIYKYIEADDELYPIKTVYSDNLGRIEFRGLGGGQYYIKEIRAPSGYRLDNTLHSLFIDAQRPESSTWDNERALSYDDNSGYYYMDIMNEKVGLLPFTGGAGTIVLTLVGLILATGSIGGIIVYYKRKKKII